MENPDKPRSQREIAEGLGSILMATTPDEEPEASSEEVEPEEAPEAPDEAEAPEDEEVVDEQAEVEDEDEVDAEDVEAEPEATEDDAFSLDLVVNGEEYTVTDRAEAQKLAQLGKHFTNLREQQVKREQEIEQEQAQLQQERSRYAQALPVLEKFLTAPLGDPPDPSQFDDQAQYLFAKDQYNEQLQNVQAVRAEMQRVQQETAEQQKAAFEKFREHHARQLEQKLPEWSDPKVRATESKDIQDYGLAMGLTEEELGNLADHRFVLILRDAMRYRQAKEAGQKKVGKKKPKTKDAAPGSGKASVDTQGRRYRKAREAIRKRGGKPQDVAPLMGALLTANPRK